MRGRIRIKVRPKSNTMITLVNGRHGLRESKPRSYVCCYHSPQGKELVNCAALSFLRVHEALAETSCRRTSSCPTAKMCKYYAHMHPCGHTKIVFAAFCSSAAFLQNPCGRGDIWATFKMEANCSNCSTESDSVLFGPKKNAPKKAVRR